MPPLIRFTYAAVLGLVLTLVGHHNDDRFGPSHHSQRVFTVAQLTCPLPSCHLSAHKNVTLIST
jgi:hypothetical protein